MRLPTAILADSYKNRNPNGKRNGTKSAYSIVEDNHNIMHSYTIIYARTTCLCIKQDSARGLSIRDIKCLFLSKGSGDSTIEKSCAWVARVGER